MVEEKHNALIPRPSGAIEKIGPGPRGILTRMVADALALARSQEKALSAARFRIGNYELRDPDYRQILLWADALELEPEGMIERLEGSVERLGEHDWRALTAFEVENGSILTLAWNFNLLPLSVFEWVDGLVIREIRFKGKPKASPQISLRLPSLVRLKCPGINLTEIDLSKTPALTELWCDDNQLTALDLSNVPGLTELSCDNNQLTELDLSKIPALTDLSCGINQLTDLDLSKTPALTELWCGDNQLTDLDLSKTPALTELWCWSNQLAALDLSNVPGLTILMCDDNQLTALDLSNVPQLISLLCYDNQLTALDLSNVPRLTSLQCHKNQLTELDIRLLEKLTDFVCDPFVALKKLPTQQF